MGGSCLCRPGLRLSCWGHVGAPGRTPQFWDWQPWWQWRHSWSQWREEAGRAGGPCVPQTVGPGPLPLWCGIRAVAPLGPRAWLRVFLPEFTFTAPTPGLRRGCGAVARLEAFRHKALTSVATQCGRWSSQNTTSGLGSAHLDLEDGRGERCWSWGRIRGAGVQGPALAPRVSEISDAAAAAGVRSWPPRPPHQTSQGPRLEDPEKWGSWRIPGVWPWRHRPLFPVAQEAEAQGPQVASLATRQAPTSK